MPSGKAHLLPRIAPMRPRSPTAGRGRVPSFRWPTTSERFPRIKFHEGEIAPPSRGTPVLFTGGLDRVSSSAMVLMFAAACSHGQGRTTWEDDEKEGVPTTVAARTSTQALALAPEIFTLDPQEVAARLERALLVFGARRRATAPAGRRWTDSVRAQWSGILAEVERAFTQPLGSLPRNLLVQVRVVLETEMETLTRNHGPAPKKLERRLALAFSHVARRLRARRPQPTEASRVAGAVVLTWPVSPVILTSGFGYRRDPIFRDGRLNFHAGVDLAGRKGDPIVAAREGEVISAGWKGGYGKAVFIQHPGGYVTVYAHLSTVLTKRGAFLSEGNPVGLMGSSGRATGSHLHFEVRRGGTPMDPMEFLRRGSQRPPLATRASRGRH